MFRSFDLDDALSRLSGVYRGNPASQIVTETRDNDSYGFAKSAASATYTVNGLNQYATVNGAAHTYDPNGSLTGTGSAAYTYDIENRLVKAVAGGTTTNLVYDPLGRLFEVNQGSSATTTRFLNDGDVMVAELNSGNGIVNRFVHGSNAAADDPLVWYSGSTLTIKRWLHADHLGSIVAWTNSSGGSPSINRYDEYGVPVSTNIGRFQYTGQAWIGELSLYYYKARFYSPGLGRFMQTDPIGYADHINLYAYVGNDPVNALDPAGMMCTGSRIDDSCDGGGLALGFSGSSTVSLTGRAPAIEQPRTFEGLASDNNNLVTLSTPKPAGLQLAGYHPILGETAGENPRLALSRGRIVSSGEGGAAGAGALFDRILRLRGLTHDAVKVGNWNWSINVPRIGVIYGTGISFQARDENGQFVAQLRISAPATINGVNIAGPGARVDIGRGIINDILPETVHFGR